MELVKETGKEKKHEWLTYRIFRSCKDSFQKLLNSNEIQDIDLALEIASIGPEFERISEMYSKGLNSVVFKYAKMSEKREITEEKAKELECSPVLGGYLTADEQESKETELQLFLNKNIKSNITFPVLSKNVIKTLYKKVKEEKAKDPKKGEFEITMKDLSSFIVLKMIEK